jgi:hypothetical protein
MKTWFIIGDMVGKLFARSEKDIRVIREGETFLGIPFAELKVGDYVEETSPDKGKLVTGKQPNW